MGNDNVPIMAKMGMFANRRSHRLFERLQHLTPQDGVDPGLITLALSSEPGQNIGIDSYGGGGLGGLVVLAANRVPPEVLRQRGNVAEVDLAVRPSRQIRKIRLLPFSKGRQVR